MVAALAAGAGAMASGISLLPSALKPKMALWIVSSDGLGAVP
jgi:threonine dehydratase